MESYNFFVAGFICCLWFVFFSWLLLKILENYIDSVDYPEKKMKPDPGPPSRITIRPKLSIETRPEPSPSAKVMDPGLPSRLINKIVPKE